MNNLIKTSLNFRQWFKDNVSDLFLSFHFYLFLIPSLILAFSIYFAFTPNDFILGTADKGSFHEDAKREVLNDLCLEDSKRYSLSITNNGCFFSFIEPLVNSNGHEFYSTKSIEISIKEASSEILNLRYVLNYEQHPENKKQDVGILEIDYTHYKTKRETILFRAIPYIPYPEETPLIEIKPSSDLVVKMSGPYKGLNFLSIGIIDISSSGTSITSSDGWPWFSLKKNKTLSKAYTLLFEGKVVFDSWIKRFWTFLYFSGITFMTVGYGDITPITTTARLITILEAFLGVVCLGMFSASFFAHTVNALFRPWKEVEKNLLRFEDWTKSTDPATGNETLYFMPNPDMRVAENSNSSSFNEPWSEIYPDPNATVTVFSVYYKSTILYNFRFIFCDGGRGVSIQPNVKVKYKSLTAHLPMHQYYYLIKGSFQEKLNKLIQHHYNSSLVFQLNQFNSEAEAENQIEKSFKGASDFLTCFITSKVGAGATLVNRK